MAKHPAVAKFDVSSVEQCISGAAPLTDDLINELKARHTSIHSVRQGKTVFYDTQPFLYM